MKNFRAQGLLVGSCLAALLSVAGPAVIGHAAGKIPQEVIDHAATQGTVLVLVGLNVPWQLESKLDEDAVRVQRTSIASIQRNLLSELAGRNYKIIRRYEQVPGIALEVGADALASLAQSPNVVNVLLDRPVRSPERTASEKVPWALFKRAADNGTVLVLAGLRAPWQQEHRISEELVSLQRKAILDAQSYILAELVGTEYKVMRLYNSIPAIALRVGMDALKVLERSPAVTNVLPDRPAKPLR
jgi:hypothetical protein